MKAVYFKSFGARERGVLETSSFDPNARTRSTCQTLSDVLTQRVMCPNTRHHVLKDRIAVSRPTADFPGTYRPEGILFTTANSPNYCAPFDLMALTYGKTLTSEDYGSDFLPGHEKFVFPDFKAMTQGFSNSRDALAKLNGLRESHGLTPIGDGRDYNEVCFENTIPIKPVALIGTSSEIAELSHRHRIKKYDSVRDYLDGEENKREMIRLSVGSGLLTAAASMLITAQTLMPEEVQKRIAEPYTLLGTGYFQK